MIRLSDEPSENRQPKPASFVLGVRGVLVTIAKALPALVIWWIAAFVVFIFTFSYQFHTTLEEVATLVGIPTIVAGGYLYAVFRVFPKRRGPQLAGISIIRCRRCSYDLTGNVSGKCPECGTTIPSE